MNKTFDVSYIEKQRREICLGVDEAKTVAIKYLAYAFELPITEVTGSRHFGVSIDKGNLTEHWEECGGSHCSDCSKVLREATELDRAFFAVLDHINVGT